MLGRKFKDRVTGFEGTCTGVADYISGCSQALIIPTVGEKGEFRPGEWFDVQRLEATGAEVLTLDNSRSPGPDREPPRRS